MPDPALRGAVVQRAPRHAPLAETLAKEVLAALRALKAEAAAVPDLPEDADMVVLVLDDAGALPETLPDLKDRAATVVAVAERAPEGRAAVAAARRRLRLAGATLGARELVLGPSHFGVIGLESDAAREKLHILLQTLVLDADRLRLRREGWEEPA